MPGAARYIIFDDDYVLLSLSRFTSPVQTITRTVLDVRIVEGMTATLTEREPMLAEFAGDDAVIGSLADAGSPMTATITEREAILCVLAANDSIIGILED